MIDPDERTARRALDGVSDAYVAIDERWRIEWANAATTEFLDRPREELVGAGAGDVLPGDVAAALRETFGDAAATDASGAPTPQSPGGDAEDRPRDVELEFRIDCDSPDGSFDVRAVAADGGVSVFIRDVTDSNRLDRELARNATIVEAVHDAVVTFDADGRVTSANQAAEGLFGADRRALIGTTVDDLASETTLDAESAATFADAAVAVREGAAAERRFSVTCEGADGRQVGDVQLVPLPIDGADGTVGVIRDVTEREEYDRVLTALHDVSRRLFGADDPDEICAIAVEAAANLLNLELSGIWLLDEERNRLDPVAATARTHDEIGGLPHFAENEGLIWDVFRSGDAELYGDLREVPGVYNPDTPVRSELIVPIGDCGVLMAGEPRPDQFDDTDLELAGILAANVEAALDRTDREQLLRRRTEELERQRDRMETVAAVLSRDIERRLSAARDALGAAGVTIDAGGRSADATVDADGQATDAGNQPTDAGNQPADAGRSPASDDGVPGRAAAAEELAIAERLVADVREVAGAAGAETARERVSLADAAADAAERVDDVTVRAIDDPSVRVDRRRFVRFLAALLRFAAGRAESEAAVHVGRLDDRDGFYVADDAPPIPEDERADVFDPEYAAALSLPGLGPAMADEIADANGWELTLAPTEGEERGARFEVTGVTTLSR